MGKGLFIGIDGKARKIRKAFIGVDGKARKIKKAWIGVAGKARLVYAGGELAYYGTVAPLRVARENPVSASVGNYALFAGGSGTGTPDNIVDAYSENLTRSTPAALIHTTVRAAGASNGTYALFAGGVYESVIRLATVTAYNGSLTRSTPTELSCARMELAGARAGEFALFAGGIGLRPNTNIDGSIAVVDAYNRTLVRSTPSVLSAARYRLAGASNQKCAVFAEGYESPVVDAYNSSLVRSSPAVFEVERHSVAGASTSANALFAGGEFSGKCLDKVDAYNANLIRSTAAPLCSIKANLAGVGNDDFAIFAGGMSTRTYERQIGLATVDSFDASLVRKAMTNLSKPRHSLAGASVGDFLLIGGGYTYDGGALSDMDAYVVK